MEVGEVVDEFQSKDLSGSEKKITCPGDDCKRVFLFFKTTCTYCEKQMAFWKSLVSQIDDRNYRVTAITAESDAQAIKDYMKSHEIDNWEVLTIKPEDAQKAKLLVTPITFVTDNRGTIERVWIGLWQPRDADSASSYFSISSLSTANPN